MFNRQQPIRSFLSAAAIFASCGFAIGVSHASSPESLAAAPAVASSADAMIDRASVLCGQKKHWQARQLLVNVLNGTASLSDGQSARAHNLLASVNDGIRALDPVTLSIQKADVALDAGDLVTATKLCESVIASNASSPQAETARQMLTEAALLRDEFAVHGSETLDRAVALFDAGKFAQSKLLLGSLKRSGMSLAVDQAQLLETYQTRLVALETTRGSLIDTADVATAMFADPGVIKRRTPPPPPKLMESSFPQFQISPHKPKSNRQPSLQLRPRLHQLRLRLPQLRHRPPQLRPRLPQFRHRQLRHAPLPNRR